MSHKAFVTAARPGAVCRFYFRLDGCWYVWLESPGLILGIGLSPAAAWRDAADRIRRVEP